MFILDRCNFDLKKKLCHGISSYFGQAQNNYIYSKGNLKIKVNYDRKAPK